MCSVYMCTCLLGPMFTWFTLTFPPPPTTYVSVIYPITQLAGRAPTPTGTSAPRINVLITWPDRQYGLTGYPGTAVPVVQPGNCYIIIQGQLTSHDMLHLAATRSACLIYRVRAVGQGHVGKFGS